MYQVSSIDDCYADDIKETRCISQQKKSLKSMLSMLYINNILNFLLFNILK